METHRPRRFGALLTAVLVAATGLSVALPPATLAAEPVATTTTLDAPSGVVFQPVTLTGHVSPAPQPLNGFIPALSLVMNGNVTAAAPLDETGTAVISLEHLQPGVYEVRAVFGGLGDFGPSESAPATIEIGTKTTTRLTSSLNPALSTQSVVFTAQVAGAPTGGTLTIVDTTTGTTMGSLQVAPGATLLEATATLSAGDHEISATYSGHGSFGPSKADLAQSVVLDQAVDATGAKIGYSAFYPVKDGYRDTLPVRGQRNEPISVAIRIFSVATGKRVATATVPEGMGAYAWSWTGRSSTGTLRAAGKYRVVQTLRDRGGNLMTATSFVVLAHKKLYWYSTSVTLNGAAANITGDWGSGWISKSRSRYTNGLRLYSGDSAVAAGYAFAIKSSPMYRNVTFKVLGRSPNGRQAVIVIWNPKLGSYLYLDTYDAPKLVGPGYAWYSTRAAMNTHRSGTRVRGAVVAINNGRPVDFDIAKVQIAYQYSVLK